MELTKNCLHWILGFLESVWVCRTHSTVLSGWSNWNWTIWTSTQPCPTPSEDLLTAGRVIRHSICFIFLNNLTKRMFFSMGISRYKIRTRLYCSIKKISISWHCPFNEFYFLWSRVLTIDNSDFGVVEEGAWAGMIKVSQVKGSKRLQIWTDVG